MKYLLILVLIADVGLFLTVANNSNALSYLSDSSQACRNCHVMNAAYESFKHDQHSRTLECNSCHVPQDSVLKKYAFKAMDGMRHATVFTLGMTPQNLILNPAAEAVVQGNCVRCHATKLSETEHGEGRLCWDCHRSTPHQRLRSQSASEYSSLD